MQKHAKLRQIRIKRLRGLLCYVLSLAMLAQLINPPTTWAATTPAASGSQGPQNQPESEAALAGEMAGAAASMAASTQQTLSYAHRIETGDFNDQIFTDPSFQVGQTISHEGNDYDLTNPQGPRLPKIEKANLLLKMRHDGKMLVFDGVFGANSQGENGKIQATHKIPFPSEIISTTGLNADNDLVMVFTADGALHALSRQLIYESVFGPGLPVFSKIWQVDPGNNDQRDKFEGFLEKYKTGNIEIRSHFLTRGTDPNYLKDVANALILPDEVKTQLSAGKQAEVIDHQAGTLYIGWSDKRNRAEKHLLAMIPRRNIFLGMIRGAIVMEMEDLVLHPNLALKRPETIQMLKEMETAFEKMPEDIQEKDVSPLVKLVLDNRTAAERDSLAKAMTAALGAVRSQAPTDQFNLQQASAFLQNALKDSDEEMKTSEAVEAQLEHFAKLQATPLKNPLSKNKQSLSSLITAKTSQLNEIFLATVPSAEVRSYLGYVLAGGVYFGYAYFFKTTGGYEFPILSWIYEHGYPPVIKNLETANTAMAGMFAALTLLPIMQGMTLITGSLFRAFSQSLEGSRSRFAQHVRAFSNDWKLGKKNKDGQMIPGSGSSMWQLLVASCLRMTAIITYPLVTVVGKSGAFLAENILRQKSLVSSLENGLNPFRLVDPSIYDYTTPEAKDSSGRPQSLQPRRMVNNPFMDAAKLAARIQENENIHKRVQASRAVKSRLALNLALLIVGEQTKTSPGEIMLARSLSARQIQELAADPAQMTELRLLEATILRDLQTASMQELVSACTTEGTDSFLSYLAAAKETAARLNDSPAFRLQAKTHALWVSFQGRVKSALAASASAGQENRLKMWKMKPSEINPVQLERATSEVAPDILMAVVLSALQGPFADPSHPERLFGQSQYPFVSPVGMYGILENLIAQLTLGVPAALMAGDPTMKDVGNPYRPIQEMTSSQVPRTECVTATFCNEMRDVHDFKKSDLGGWNTRYFKTRWGFFQYLLLTGVVLRMSSFQEQGITWKLALGSFLAYEMGKWLFYRPIWTYIRVGSMVNRDRYQKNIEKINEFKVTLGRMVDSPSPGDFASMRGYYQEILKVYEDSNPGVLRKIYKLAKRPVADGSRQTPLGTHQSYRKFEHYGLVFQLLQARQTLAELEAREDVTDTLVQEETARIDRLETTLLEAIDKSEPTDDIIIENLRGMIEMIRTNSPLVTASHDQYHNLKVLLAGAIGTTILALQLQDITTTQQFVHSPLQWLMLGGGSALFVYLFGKATSAKTWTDFSRKWIRTKEAAAASVSSLKDRFSTQKGPSVPKGIGLSCKTLLR
jgi:hypothetical protein